LASGRQTTPCTHAKFLTKKKSGDYNSKGGAGLAGCCRKNTMRNIQYYALLRMKLRRIFEILWGNLAEGGEKMRKNVRKKSKYARKYTWQDQKCTQIDG